MVEDADGEDIVAIEAKIFVTGIGQLARGDESGGWALYEVMPAALR